MVQNVTDLLSRFVSAVDASVFVTSNESEATTRCSHFWALGDSPQLSAEVETIKSVAYHYILPAIIFFGIVGNLINLVVLRYFTGKTFVYLFWLAVSDLAALIASTCWVYRVSSCPTSIFDALITCHVLHVAVHTFCASSAFIVVTLTAIRFWAVCFPMSSVFLGTPSRTRVAIALCFMLAFIFYAPMSFLYRVETIAVQQNETSTSATMTVCHVCKFSDLNDRSFSRIYVSVRETISRILPVILVALLNIAIILALSRHQERRTSLGCSSQQKKQAEEQRLVVLLKAVMIIFLICTTPIAILQTTLVTSQIDDFAFEVFRAAANLLVLVNTAMNLYLYCLYSASIRQRLAVLFCQCFGIKLSNPARSVSIDRASVNTFGTPLRSTQNIPNDCQPSGKPSEKMEAVAAI